jgi:hypothetical protein
MKRYFAKLMLGKDQVARMCICDTQISVGDNIWYYSRDNNFLFNGTLAKIDDENIFLEEDRDIENPDVQDAFYMCYRKKTAFKVIGMVSPDAIWVKEGDDFDEADLLQHGCGVNLTTNGGKVKIKCSQCQTYH